MNIIERALAFREGGQTQRCHTMQFVGPYNVAIHSYNALILLMLLYDEGLPSLNLIKAVLWHDIPERWTGDVPTPTKMADPMLRGLLNILERKVLFTLGIEHLFENLNAKEQDWLDAIDLLELFIWSQEQFESGNKNIQSLINQILKIFATRISKIPEPVKDFVKDFKWSRSIECHELIGDLSNAKGAEAGSESISS